MQIVRCVIGWDARYTRYIFIKVHTSTIEYYTHQYESMMLSYRNKFNECDLNKNLHILTDLTGDVSSYEQFYSRNTQNIRILVVYTKTRDRNNTIAWESTDFFADFTGHAIPCFHMETMSIHKMYTYVSDPRTQGVRRGSVHCRQHAHDRVRDTKFSLVRYSHTSVFREWRSYFFFFTRGRCNVTFVTCYARYEITFDTGTFLAWPVAAALLLSLQDQQRKLKLSTCPLTRGHFR